MERAKRGKERGEIEETRKNREDKSRNRRIGTKREGRREERKGEREKGCERKREREPHRKSHLISPYPIPQRLQTQQQRERRGTETKERNERAMR